jgi:L-malate glycosyltransferase
MYEVSERYHLDLLHVHYAIPHSVSAFLAKQIAAPKRRLPFVTTLHGTDITIVGADPALFPTTKWSIEQSDGITAISEFVKRRTEDFFGVRCPIDVIRNFVNCEIYRPAPERRSKRKRLMHISNFRPVKRVLDCVRILAEVRREVDAELLMVGDGPDRGPAETLARELGLDRHIDFVGKQDHVERLFPEAHVLLMPSELEAFGLVALEAMACGTPPVATNCGGVPELITPGLDGFLEPVGDVKAQGRRVVELLTDASMYARMSVAARHTAEARFCTDKIIPKYEQHYIDVING